VTVPTPKKAVVAHRLTEGTPGVPAPDAKRRVGRPRGSRNKPKSLVPAEIAYQLLATVENYLPREHVTYLRQVIKEGAVLSTKHELDILLAVLNRNLMFAMLEEMPFEVVDEETGERTLKAYAPSKDITDRIKAAKEMLALRNTIEKGEQEEGNGLQPLIAIIGSRDLDPTRLRILVGVDTGGRALPAGDEPRILLGESDLLGWSTDSPGAISSPLAERQELLPALHES
jgi:hypothetical protein